MAAAAMMKMALAACLLLCALVVDDASAAVVQAQSSELFADSVCVNTHFRFAGTSYQTNHTRLVQLLVEAGIRNVRDDSGGVSGLLGANNIKVNFFLDDLRWHADNNISDIARQIADLKGYIRNGMLIDAVLGANEPNSMWPDRGVTYNGQGFPNGVIDHMRDMYTLLRQDATFDNRWIIASPLAVGSVLPANCCSQWADYGDMHPYPLDGAYLAVTFVPYANISRYFYFSNQPSTNLDQFPEIWDQAKAYYPDRPWFASETGYTTQTGGLGTSLRAHGLYMNRLFAEYFRLGIKRTCVYEMLDSYDRPADFESNFGLVHANYTPKPAYDALKRLMAIVRSAWKPTATQLRPPAYDLGSLNFSLVVSPVGQFDLVDYVHHLLLQQPSGVFLLLLWHEISEEDTSTVPNRQIYPPLMPAVLTLPPTYTVRIWAPNDGAAPTGRYSANGLSTFANPSNISLFVPDHVIVLQLEATTSMSGAASLASWLAIFVAFL